MSRLGKQKYLIENKESITEPLDQEEGIAFLIIYEPLGDNPHV